MEEEHGVVVGSEGRGRQEGGERMSINQINGDERDTKEAGGAIARPASEHLPSWFVSPLIVE